MNHERWLVSYADFITLMFAFFVVMFANSSVDKSKAAIISATFNSISNGGAAPSRGKHPSPVAVTPPSPARSAQALTMAELKPTQERLQDQLREEIIGRRVEISLQARGLVLSLKESAFFAPGQDVVSPAARPILAKVADSLRQIPGQIRLEGHTDNKPIHSQKFPSNWKLSTARSIAVLKLLTADLGLPAERFAVAGYGEYHPLESNQDADSRAKNRRVDLVILTQDAAAMAPA